MATAASFSAAPTSSSRSSAAQRQESRGAHFREDYPEKDEEWGKASLVVKKASDGTMDVSREPVMDIPAELQAIIEENR